MNRKTTLRTEAWLLRGISSLPGMLMLSGDRLSFEAFGRGSFWTRQLRALERDAGRPGLAKLLDESPRATVFDIPLSEIREIRFPWYYFMGGMKLTIQGVQYRFSFARPANTQTSPDAVQSLQDISVARGSGKAWKEALMNHGAGRS